MPDDQSRQITAGLVWVRTMKTFTIIIVIAAVLAAVHYVPQYVAKVQAAHAVAVAKAAP